MWSLTCRLIPAVDQEPLRGDLPLSWIQRLQPRRFGKVFQNDVVVCRQVRLLLQSPIGGTEYPSMQHSILAHDCRQAHSSVIYASCWAGTLSCSVAELCQAVASSQPALTTTLEPIVSPVEIGAVGILYMYPQAC